MREGFSCFLVAIVAIGIGQATAGIVAGQTDGQAAPANVPDDASRVPSQEPRSTDAIANDTNGDTAQPSQHTAPPTQPEWWPLPDDQAKHVSQLLDYWQKSSDQIRQCTCEFTRWDYDPAYCNYRNPQTQELAAFAVWRGELRFAAPDKAMFETRELWKFKLDNNQPDMEKSEDQSLKLKWICDGKYVYDYNFTTKVLTDIAIPAEFQGEGLVNSPLPFLFGANRDTLLNRYWIRPITPASATDEYWLQVVPKRLEDARTYSRVEIIISRQDFLPKSMIIFSANYDPKTDPVSQAYLFENRKINDKIAAVQDFFTVFIRPKAPLGWTRVEQKAFHDDNVTAQKDELQRANRK